MGEVRPEKEKMTERKKKGRAGRRGRVTGQTMTSPKNSSTGIPPLLVTDERQIAELTLGSAISLDVIAKARLFTEDDPKRLVELAGRRVASWGMRYLPALGFPFFTPGQDDPVLYRVKPKEPMPGGTKTAKYVQAKGSGYRIYFGPSLLRDDDLRRDTGIPIWLTEGEKKVLSLESHGLPAAGVTGVNCWHKPKTKPKVLHPDFDHLELVGRRVFIVFDSDMATKSQVQFAARELVHAIAARGAIPHLVRLPEVDAAKCGVDDFLKVFGIEPFLDLCAATPLEVWPDGALEPLIYSPWTDAGNAERIVELSRGQLRAVSTGSRIDWYWWDGLRWRKDETGLVVRIAKMTARATHSAAAFHDDEEGLRKHARKSEAGKGLRDALRLAASEAGVGVRFTNFDSDRMLLNVKNGVVDLRTGVFRRAKPQDMCSKAAGVRYDALAEASRWLQFLDEVFEGDDELIEFVRRLAGYCLSGDVSEDVAAFFIGAGANGKSTFMQVLLALLGDYGAPADPSLLLTSTHERHPTGIADLLGRRLAVVHEIERGTKLSAPLMKRLTGGDTIKARFMRGDFFSFEPTHKFVLLGNSLPSVPGGDEAMWRRIRVVPFHRVFAKDERNPNLADELLEELPGILNWAIEGCLAWQRHGLGEPPAVAEANAEYRDEVDIVGRFLRHCCERDASAYASAHDLYAAFKTWCAGNLEPRLQQRSFGLELTRRRIMSKKVNGRVVRVGIRLSDEIPEGGRP